MSTLACSRVEAIAVGGYVLLATSSGVLLVGLAVTGPHFGVTFVLLGLFWLCVLAAVATALVVLGVNAWRTLRHEPADRVAVGFATLLLVALGGGLYAAFLGNALQMGLVLGVIGLVLAPLGCCWRVLGETLRSRSTRVSRI